MKRSWSERKIKALTGKWTLPENTESLAPAKTKLAILKRNFKYREWFPKFRDEVLRKEGHKKAEITISLKNIYRKIKLGRAEGLSKKELQEFVDFYDPYKEIPAGEPSQYLGTILGNQLMGLHMLFLDQGVRGEKRKDLMPYETSFRVDLRIRKAQLLREFEFELDEVLSKRNGNDWEPDESREGREAVQLQVWDLREMRTGFPAIAKKLKMSQDLAKYHFYRAFELTQGFPYDRDKFQREAWKDPKLQKNCQACPDYPANGGTCRELCPEVLSWVSQDQKSILGKPQSFEVLSNIKNHSWNQFEDFGEEEEETLYSDEDTEKFREEVIHPAKFIPKTITKKKK